MPNTYDTSKYPLGSPSPFVLYNNAGNEDLFMSDMVNEFFIDRPPFLRRRYTLFGMEQDFKRALARIGFESTYLTYGAGVVIQRGTQLVIRSGVYYRVTNPTNVPLTLTGDWAVDGPKLTDVGDASLRSALVALVGAGLVGFDSTLTYPANSVGAALVDAKNKKEQKNSIEFDMFSNLGDLSTLNTALKSGTVRMAFASDSIVEGDRDGVYENSTAAIVMRTLRAQNPSVTFVFGNFSLAGRGIATYFDTNYKGIAGPTDDPATGFYRPPGNQFTAQWPNGSVVGKAWIDHLKDFAPDLIVLAFGANDLSSSGPIGAAQYKSALTYQGTWPKVPSVALATAALPAVSAGYQSAVQVAANTARGIAKELKHTLIDINRLMVLKRQAIDTVKMPSLRDDSFIGYPSGWTPDVGSTLALLDSGGFAIQGTGGALRNTQSSDINIAANFSMANWSTQTGELWYRSLGALATRYTAQVTSGSVFLYYGSTIIGSASIATIPNNTTVNLQACVYGNEHKIYVNGILVITVYDYNYLLSGAHGVRATGGIGIISALIVHTSNPYQVGLPELTDTDIYGINDFNTNQLSVGGNGINHPTILANKTIWAAAFAGLEHHIRSFQKDAIVSVVAPFRAQSAEAFDISGATLQTSIDGALTGSATGILVTSTGAVANKYDCKQVVGGRSITVSVILSAGPTALLSLAVVLPVGTWLLTASAQFTKDSAGVYRNALTVTGVRSA